MLNGKIMNKTGSTNSITYKFDSLIRMDALLIREYLCRIKALSPGISNYDIMNNFRESLRLAFGDIMSRYEIIVYEDCREITYRGKKIKLGEQQHIVVCKTITKLFHDTFQLHSTERPGLCRTWEGKDLTKRKPEEIKNSMDNVIRDILPDSIITYSNVNSIVRDIRDKTSPDIIVNIKKQGIYFNYSPLFINYIKGHAFSHILD